MTADAPASADPSPLLRCRGLAKTFGGVRALRGLDLDVRKGEVCGVIGPNGAGKTTLLNLLAGADRPTAGFVEFRGRRLDGLGPAAVCRLGLARTFQIPRPFGRLTVLENVLVAALAAEGETTRWARERARRALELTGLDRSASREARTLTLAGRKRLELARALATGPVLLLLDETAAGLDPSEAEETVALLAALHRAGLTFILVEHVLRVVTTLATRLLVLEQGAKLAEGPPAQVLASPLVQRAYLSPMTGGET